ncbi:alpha/beta hydrolase [Actinospica sp.]|uniref:alpha/beta fold hydrolase n=1 Tax=Actinospica sp. TaxID=1872142 RepID=UPI002BFA6B04|nr:alpha/beta hydrolase [Actinospica sp.]HWG25382.1 alpha/beta hydrolase [Actinospica sp.]
MKLNTREWGSGGRIALLAHGIMSDSRTWRRVGPALAERGCRVVGVDLRGHGASGRGDEYSNEAYGADIVETLEGLGGVDVAIGHSLGARAVLFAVEAGWRPSKAVYVDPAWRIARPGAGSSPKDPFVEFADHATREQIAELCPRWEPEDVEIELATLALWDRQTALQLPKHNAAALESGRAGDGTGLPVDAKVPSLIMLADNSQMLSAQDAETLRGRGFELRTVPGAGHSVHRDDFEGFMAALDGWI